jgi:predicted ester cyclase
MKYANAILLSLTCFLGFGGTGLAQPTSACSAAGEQQREERNVRTLIKFQTEMIPNLDFTDIEKVMAPVRKKATGKDPAHGTQALVGMPPRSSTGRSEDMKKFTRDTFEGMKDHRRTMEEIYGIGDTVVARWRIEGVVTGKLLGVPGHGRSINIQEVGFTQFDCEGRMLGGWAMIDGADLLHQLGVTAHNLQQNGAPLNKLK